MAAPLFYDETYTSTGFTPPLLLNRWSRSNYSIIVDVGTTSTFTVEGTVSRLNLDDGLTPVWFEFLGLVGITTVITTALKETPLEAVRLNIGVIDSTIRLQVMQGGEG